MWLNSKTCFRTFEKAWEAHREERRVTGKEHQRRGTDQLADSRRSAVFILVYIKLYPLQAVLGFLFGMS